MLGLCGVRAGAAPLPAVDLGEQVRSANRVGFAVFPNSARGGHDLVCWSTTAESGGHFVVLDLKTREVLTHPLKSLEAWPIIKGSDRNIYVGSSSGEVMRWNPRTGAWGPLGKPLFAVPGVSINHVRCLCEGPDRWLYAGSCYGERARVNMITGKVEKLPPTPEKGTWYVASVVRLPDGRIAFGYGYQARIFVYSPRLGKDVGQWMPKGWTEGGFCMGMAVAKSVLYAFHFPSGRRGIFDAHTGKFLGKVPWPDAVSGKVWSKWGAKGFDFHILPGTDTIVSCDGVNVHQYDPRDGRLAKTYPLRKLVVPRALALPLRYGMTTDCRLLVMDRLGLKLQKIVSIKQPEVSRRLFGLGMGPDGKVYGGAYQSTMLFAYDPAAKRSVMLGDHHPGWSGETYSFAVRGSELICASYTNGAIVAYDPGKPWKCELNKMQNPRCIGFLGQLVYRPYATVVGDDGRIWSAGAAGWGTPGGGVAYIDPDTKKTAATSLPDVPLQAIKLPGDRLLICSEKCVRWWDCKLNREIAQAIPPVGITDATRLDAWPPARVLLASEKQLVMADVATPGKLDIVRTVGSPLPVVRVMPFGGQVVVAGLTGLATVNPDTGAANCFCSTPFDSRWAIAVTANAVFFGKEARLMMAGVPGAQAGKP